MDTIIDPRQRLDSFSTVPLWGILGHRWFDLALNLWLLPNEAHYLYCEGASLMALQSRGAIP